MNELLKQALAMKPGELAATLASLVGQVAAIVDRLDGDDDDLKTLRKLLESTSAYAEAAQQVLGGYDWGELAKTGPLVAGGSGKERLEADLMAEARGTDPAGFWPAPTTTKPTGGPPPAQGED